MNDEYETERAFALAKHFVEDMTERGVTTIDDEALRYHLALLIKRERQSGQRQSAERSDK